MSKNKHTTGIYAWLIPVWILVALMYYFIGVMFFAGGRAIGSVPSANAYAIGHIIVLSLAAMKYTSSNKPFVGDLLGHLIKSAVAISVIFFGSLAIAYAVTRINSGVFPPFEYDALEIYFVLLVYLLVVGLYPFMLAKLTRSKAITAIIPIAVSFTFMMIAGSLNGIWYYILPNLILDNMLSAPQSKEIVAFVVFVVVSVVVNVVISYFADKRRKTA